MAASSSNILSVNQVNVAMQHVHPPQQNFGSEEQNMPPADTKLTPEQEEEIKLRAKYPLPQKPGGSSFMQKMLHKGSKKYFDSGDYNMAKSKNKLALSKQTPPSLQQQNLTEVVPTSDSTEMHLSSIDNPPTTPTVSVDLPTLTPVTINSNSNDNPSLSPSVSCNFTNTQHLTTNPTLSSSISTSSMNQMLSSSLSTDKLTNFQLKIDDDEIGHGIPTPESIPQTRKHSIVQSKLATPTLSSS